MKLELLTDEMYPVIFVRKYKEEWEEDSWYTDYEISDDLAERFLTLHKEYWKVHEEMLNAMRRKLK